MFCTARVPSWLLAVPFGLTACAPVDPELARAEWMREVLVTADRMFLAREPELVADKYAAMAADPYAWMRGTVPWYYAARSRPDPSRPPTAFLANAASTAVLLVGDPHPENCSTLATTLVADPVDTVQTVEFIDLDAAGWGPWLLDVRRGALGLHTLSAQLAGCGADCRAEVVAAFSDAYAEAIVDKAREGLVEGFVLVDLLEEATNEGPQQRRLERDAPDDGSGHGRAFVREAGVLEEPSRSEKQLFDDVFATMAPDLPDGLRVLDVARRYGRGISSMPAIRFSVVVDRGDDGPQDDALVDIREVLDPVPLPGRAVQAPATFENNGHRVGRAARTLWTLPDADPYAAHGCLGRHCFKSLSKHSWFQDIERSKVIEEWMEDDLSPADIADLAADLGGVLARAHMRGGVVDGRDSGIAIRDDLLAGGGVDALRTELLRDTAAEHRRLLDDHALFVGMLDIYGPILGADDMLEHLP